MSDLKDFKMTMLKPADNKAFLPSISTMLIPGETITCTYKIFAANYGAVFTNKRIITITPQELTKAQTAFTSIHYSKIQSYSAMVSNGRGLNNDLKLWVAGSGDFELGFASRTDVFEACKIISMYTP